MTTGLYAIVALAKDFINTLLPFIIALTVLVFLWGIFQFVRSSDTGDREEARGYIIWGIIALFVMVSVWGLVNVLVSTFNFNNTVPTSPVVPTI